VQHCVKDIHIQRVSKQINQLVNRLDVNAAVGFYTSSAPYASFCVVFVAQFVQAKREQVAYAPKDMAEKGISAFTTFRDPAVAQAVQARRQVRVGAVSLSLDFISTTQAATAMVPGSGATLPDLPPAVQKLMSPLERFVGKPGCPHVYWRFKRLGLHAELQASDASAVESADGRKADWLGASIVCLREFRAPCLL